VQDILNGEGLCFLDPHGKSADLLLEYVPEHRIKYVIYFAPFDMEHPVSFNVMEDVGPEQRYLVASGMMSAFKKIWVDAWSARMEYILGNIMLALLEYPGSTLVAVNRMLTDKDFRKEVVNHISDPSVKSFWVNEYANYTEKFAAEAAPAIQNKVGQFVANPLIRNIIGQPKSSFDIRDVMDNRKILIINLSKGRVGEANANLLGSMLITKIYLGAMSRADLSERELEKAPNFYLYVDEFQSFANESFADILSEARKYKLALSIAHQYIEQMTDEVRAAVFGNVGTMVTFRVGAYDAEVLEKEFSPYFLADDIVALQKYQMYLKLMIDGVTSPPFSASGMEPPPRPDINYTNEILASSRALYAKPRQQVEDELLAWIQKKFGQGGGSGAGGNSGNGGGSGGNGGGSSGGSSNANRNSGGSGSSYSGGGTGGASNGGAPRSDTSNRGSSYSSSGRNPVGSSQSGSRGGNFPQRSAYTSSSSSAPQSVTSSSSMTHNSSARPSSGSAPSAVGPREQRDIGAQRGIQGGAPQRAPHTESRSTDSNARLVKSTSPNRDGDQQVGVEREQELRKAMSLSYLKTEPAEPKPEKIPKPENIAALREALLSVMNQESSAPKTVITDTISNQEKSHSSHLEKESSVSSVEKNAHNSHESGVHVETHSNAHAGSSTSSSTHHVSSHSPRGSHHHKQDAEHSREQTREQVSEEALKSVFSE
ncbi:MAG: hypothetical protein QG568_695, partial [Patescibacteria group bacterium]|nr:hypothetical protein [Patescibacteria group bacterium]